MKNKPPDQPVRKIRKSKKAVEKSMTKIEITLSPGLREYIEMKVKTGLYEDISDVVRDALRSLHSREISSSLNNFRDGDIEALDFTILRQTLYDMLDDLIGALDGMNELSEMTSLRLQMTMDRRSKFIETLSNIMKKISTTQDTLTQNLK